METITCLVKEPGITKIIFEFKTDMEKYDKQMRFIKEIDGSILYNSYSEEEDFLVEWEYEETIRSEAENNGFQLEDLIDKYEIDINNTDIFHMEISLIIKAVECITNNFIACYYFESHFPELYYL